jgi:hypothetical protein
MKKTILFDSYVIGHDYVHTSYIPVSKYYDSRDMPIYRHRQESALFGDFNRHRQNFF